MDPIYWWLYVLAFGIGGWFGLWSEARKWREKGDHEYMNTKESGGQLYLVRKDNGTTGQEG